MFEINKDLYWAKRSYEDWVSSHQGLTAANRHLYPDIEERIEKERLKVAELELQMEQGWQRLLDEPIDAWKILDLDPNQDLTQDIVDLAVGRAMATAFNYFGPSRSLADIWVDNLARNNYESPLDLTLSEEMMNEYDEAFQGWIKAQFDLQERACRVTQQRIGRAMIIVYSHYGWDLY